MDIEKYISRIIPPADYNHRNGFDNAAIIDGLNDNEKNLVSGALINMLWAGSDDTLIVTTLAYMKSKTALPALYDLLEKAPAGLVKIMIAVSIFQISADENMIETAICSFKQLDDKKDAYYVYKLVEAFYYLRKFSDPGANKLIEQYVNHPEYLLSYNAKINLGIRMDLPSK